MYQIYRLIYQPTMNRDNINKHRPNTELEKIACDLALVYEGIYPTIITTIAVCMLYGYQFHCNDSTESEQSLYIMCAILVLTLVLNAFVAATKKIFKTERPCQTMEIDTTRCCPESYDVPSGHAALGIFHGLLLYNVGYHNLSMFFFLQPVLRYIGKQHSLSALTLGGIYGIVFYLIFAYFFCK